MGLKLKPVIKKIMKTLKPYGFSIVRTKGDHIAINKYPPLRRPIILVNEERLSKAVKRNLLKACGECGIDKEEFNRIF